MLHIEAQQNANLEVPTAEFSTPNRRRSALFVASIATIVVIVCVIFSVRTVPLASDKVSFRRALHSQSASDSADSWSDDSSEETPSAAPVTPVDIHAHWGYEGHIGPEYWVSLGYSDCAGSKQSPINIQSVSTDDDDEVTGEFEYNTADFHLNLENNGHTVVVKLPQGSHVINYDDDAYNLLGLHFHHPSEHTVDGVSFDAEVHFVHKSEKGQYVVLALLCNVGAIGNPIFDVIESGHFPLNEGDTDSVRSSTSFDILQAVGIRDSGANVYSYTGSFTTPPCTEGVQFLVVMDTFIITQEQLDVFKSAVHVNNRPVQDLNGRSVDARRVNVRHD